MNARCHDQTHGQWADYGGRGISVCDEWRGDTGLARFIADMGERPPKRSLDRRDNDGGYNKANCRWATKSEQNRNTRANVFLTYRGKTACVAEWANELGITRDTIGYRLKSGMPIERVLFPGKLTRNGVQLST